MKKQQKLLTPILTNILLHAISVLGIITFFSYDITNFFVDQNEVEKWWQVRMIVINSGYCLLAILPKLFPGNPKLNVIINIGLCIFISDLIGRATGDTERDVWDILWVLIIIGGCIYEYRKRSLHTQ